ncbi:TM helix repeat-containing protein [Cylindrospermum sp. NIES-4074]|nr:TM helix repeat-containing protein [Cylindrospermum sp. NIES-4074]
MNTTWPGITQAICVQQFLAQLPSLPTETSGVKPGIAEQLTEFMPRLLGAVAILLVGWVIAAIAASVTHKILKRTNIDNRIASGVTGRQDLPQVEKLISDLVFWSIILLTVVAILQVLGLEGASRPLTGFLNQLIGISLLNAAFAGIILGAAWLLATVVRIVTIRGLETFKLDEFLNQAAEDGTPNLSQLSVSKTIGNGLYWFILLLSLIPVLETLELKEALQPLKALIQPILSTVPNILAAALIATIGWFLANVVRRIVSNLLKTTGIDHLGSRLGLSPTTRVQSLSTIIGAIAYILILLPVVIASLNALKIEAISTPAIAMLQQILNTLPAIFTAVGILIVAYFLGRFVADIVTSILTSLGFNNIFAVLGLPSPTTPTVASEDETIPVTPTRTPSEIAGIITLVGIILFGTVAAVNILNISALTVLVTGILLVLGRILSGFVVFAIGLFLANLAFSIISSSGNPQAKILGQVARISIITLVSAMALQQIGVAPDIVNLAFGLLLGAIAVAIALAFGLGGRDIAQEQVRDWLDSFKNKE